MKFSIEYAATCHKGYVRSMNQDNLWCAGTFLECDNEGLPIMLTGFVNSREYPAFAVFDGMGGEQQGEVASFIASEHFDELNNIKSKRNAKLFLSNACYEINKKICDHMVKNNIRQMGTTCATLLFKRSKLFFCNIGDSRIYRCCDSGIVQLSLDHIDKSVSSTNPPLTQNLGIPETEFEIEPYINSIKTKCGDRYLLCSDGLTDMLSDKEIYSLICTCDNVSDATSELIKKALERGGVDNITIIVCEVKRANSFSL